MCLTSLGPFGGLFQEILLDTPVPSRPVRFRLPCRKVTHLCRLRFRSSAPSRTRKPLVFLPVPFFCRTKYLSPGPDFSLSVLTPSTRDLLSDPNSNTLSDHSCHNNKDEGKMSMSLSPVVYYDPP